MDVLASYVDLLAGEVQTQNGGDGYVDDHAKDPVGHERILCMWLAPA